MAKESSSPQTVDDYIVSFPAEVHEILQKIRDIVLEVVPEAEEVISYQMPTYRLGGNLVHFAAFKSHIGLYPTPSGIEAFQGELTPYQHAKGSIRFPLDQPIPYDLIRKIVTFRVNEMLENGKD
ncbi:MAG: DUF1801 domain-containing protein [Brevefilum sp.]|nr:DUF1801 domain-containing protein [Brevefilum sp.]